VYRALISIGILAAVLLPQPALAAEPDAAEIGKKLSNPVSDLWALFTEFDFAFNGGKFVDDLDKPAYTMGFQPVMPLNLSENYRLIVRPSIPVVFSASIPGPGPTGIDFDRHLGLGDIFVPLLLSPKPILNLPLDVGLVGGLGPTLLFPTATDKDLGGKQWGAGPSAALAFMRGNVVTGVFPQYWWGYASEDTKRPRMNKGILLYFFFYNLPDAMQIGFNPNITYDARAESGNKWNVPVGITVAKTTKVGGMPVKFQLGAEYSVVSQDDYGKRFMLKLNIIPVIAPLIKGPIF
jgi:hypothetical protein